MRRLGALFLPLLVACGPAAAPPQPPAPAASTAPPPVVATTPVPQPTVAKPAPISAPETCNLAWSDVPVWSPRDPSIGPATARVTLVFFLDLDDPFTARAMPTVMDLRDEVGPDNLRIVWKHNPLPFHATAKRAAKLAQVVFAQRGGDAFLRFARAALDLPRPRTEQQLFELAAREGLTSAQDLEAQLEDPALDELIASGERLARGLDLRGVPAFLMNGAPLSGAQPLDRFREVHRRANLAARQDTIDACVATQRELPSRPAAADPEPAEKREDERFVFIPVGASPARGAADALVTIVAFGGYQDPFSRRATSTLKPLLEKHPADLRYVWKDFPLAFHKHGVPSAALARRVLARSGVKAFWTTHDEMMGLGNISDESLKTVASKLGLPVPGATKTKEIEADVALGSDAGVAGTPAFFINGRSVVGAQSAETFERIVGEELAKAKKLVASGTPRAGIYEAAMRANGATVPTKRPKK